MVTTQKQQQAPEQTHGDDTELAILVGPNEIIAVRLAAMGVAGHNATHHHETQSHHNGPIDNHKSGDLPSSPTTPNVGPPVNPYANANAVLGLATAVRVLEALSPGPTAPLNAPNTTYQRPDASTPNMKGYDPQSPRGQPQPTRGEGEARPPEASQKDATRQPLPQEIRRDDEGKAGLHRPLPTLKEHLVERVLLEKPQAERVASEPNTRPEKVEAQPKEIPIKQIERQATPETPPAREPAPRVTPAEKATLDDPRNDAARLIQQILSGEQNTRPQAPQPTPPEQIAPVDPALNSIRNSVAASLEQLREPLRTAIEQSSPRASQEEPHRPTAPQPVGDFTKTEPISRAAPQTQDLHGQDRGGDSQRPQPIDPTVTSPSSARDQSTASGTRGAPTEGRTDPETAGAKRGQEHNSADPPLSKHLKDSSLIDSIAKVTDKIMNADLLRKVDAAVETAVISVAAAVALGAMGAEAVTKSILEMAREIARLLEGENSQTVSLEQQIQQLEEMCNDRDIEKVTTPADLVADVTGEIHDASGLPIEGTIVDGGQLGTAISDINGHFRFANVPLETGFILTFVDGRYLFNPSSIVGTVAGMNNYSVQGTKK